MKAFLGHHGTRPWHWLVVSVLLASALLPAVASGANSTQVIGSHERSVLEDGSVTIEELAGSAELYLACMEQNLGIEGEAQFDERSQAFVYSFTDSDHDMGAKINSQAAAECEGLYVDDIEAAWAGQVAPSRAEQRVFYEGVAQCMRTKGFPVTDADPDTLEYWLNTQRDAYDGCYYRLLETGFATMGSMSK